MVFRNPSNLKIALTVLVSGFILYTVFLDFTDPSAPNWNLFHEEELPSAIESYGAKAAMLAMAGAATLFISLIPIGSSRRSRGIDLSVQIVGAIAVGCTGWFWLLSATNGNPGPYLAAIVPSMAVFAVVFTANIIMRLAYDLDERQIEETGRAKLTWKSVILGLVFLLAFALMIVVIVFIPIWLF